MRRRLEIFLLVFFIDRERERNRGRKTEGINQICLWSCAKHNL